MNQAMLAEIRQLRNDLQTAAATIQRVQIAMYRLQSQEAVMERVTRRRDQLRDQCTQIRQQQKELALPGSAVPQQIWAKRRIGFAPRRPG